MKLKFVLFCSSRDALSCRCRNGSGDRKVTCGGAHLPQRAGRPAGGALQALPHTLSRKRQYVHTIMYYDIICIVERSGYNYDSAMCVLC